MLSTTEFIDALAQSNLVTPELIARIRKRVAESKSVDPRSIAKYLIDKGHLSLWQANQLLAGRRAFFLGRYKLIDRIGKGGMGVVFKARHAVMDRVVALKVMSRALLENAQAVARFNREVKTAAALNHPNIITAYDADAVGNTHFLVMEYVEGRDLNAWLKAKGPLPVAAACECALQAAQGLAYAGRQGMVHRDIKPVNLLVTWNPEIQRPIVKILDLGLARFISESQEEGGLTRLGQTIGTPDYIAPEAAESFRDADIRADIFSLGCTLFKLLTGRLPFPGENTMEKLLARTKGDAPPLRAVRNDVPEGLEKVLAKMLARDPRNRYQTPAELIAALSPYAASTSGEAEAVQFFSQPMPEAGAAAAGEIHADADTSLADFFRDFSVSPLRDEKPAAPRPAVDDDALELAPDEDEPQASPRKPAPVATAASAPPPASKRAKSRKPPRIVEPIAEEEQAVVAVDEADPLEAVESRSSAVARQARPPKPPRRMAETTGRLAKPRNAWDSPLLLAGGGTLLLLVIVAGALFWSVNRRTGDDMLKAADAAYKGGSYTQAVQDYDNFLKEFSDHKEASRARVFRGLARMRQAASGTTDWAAALTTTRQALTEISGETAFGDAGTELASVLPTLAEGIARQADKVKDAKLVEHAHKAVELVNKYVPKDLRPGARISEVERSLEATAREIARSSALTKAVAEMRAGAESGAIAGAYAQRRQLLKSYPDLEQDASLRDAVLAVTAAEQKAVKVDATSHPAETAESESLIAGTVSLAAQQGKNAPGVEGQLVYTLAAGAACAVDATTGNLLWRRNVGAMAAVVPVPVSTEAGADALVVDAARQELCRVEGRTGKLRWRQGLGDTVVGKPVVVGAQGWVATQDGKLLAIDLESGAAALLIQLPQKLDTSPTLDATGQHLYQPGDHSSLFVLSPKTGECEEVFYLGHEAGTVLAPPLSVSRYVFVAENHLLDNARLRVLLTDEKNGKLREVAGQILEGHVQAQPQVVDRALYVVTDRGAVYGLEIVNPGQGKPLTQQAASPATSTEHVLRLFVARPAHLWVASNELKRYDVQLARGRLNPAAERYRGDVFQEPLEAVANVLFHARRKPGQTSVILSAIDLATGDPFWETEMAAPIAAILPSEDGSEVTAVTASGAMFRFDAAALDARATASNPESRAKGSGWLGGDTQITKLSPTAVALCSDGNPPCALLIGQEQGVPKSAAWIAGDSWGAAACGIAGNLAAPTEAGVVNVFDPSTGRVAAQPFQAQWQAGVTFDWYDPADVGQKQLLLADSAAQIYLLSIEEKPIRHLFAQARQALPEPLASAPAVAGRTAYVISAKDEVISLSLPDLKAGEPFPLAAPACWGPGTAGAAVYVATSDGKLLAFDGGAKPRWQAVLPEAITRGQIVASGAELILTTAAGAIVRLDAATGKQLSKMETGEHFCGKPVVVGERLLVGSMDGSVHAITIPK